MAARIEPVIGGTKINDILLRDFTSKVRSGYVRMFPEGYGPRRTNKGYLLPKYMGDIEKRIREFEVRPDDVWVSSYPKAGTTWTQELSWCIGNDLDFDRAKSTLLPLRYPFVEYSGLFNFPDDPNAENTPYREYLRDTVKFTEKLESPRYIKTHLPWGLLPEQVKTKKPKIIYVARNPKDTCVSYFHHAGIVARYKGNFENIVELFLEDTLPYAPFWDHLASFWEHRDDPNVLLIKYEDMIKDLPSVIRKVTSFLGKDQLNDEDMKKLCDHLSFESMKSNPSVNYEYDVDRFKNIPGLPINDKQFIRKGKDLPSVIRKVASFLDKKPLNDEDMKVLCEHLSFDSMKSNISVNNEHTIELFRRATGLHHKENNFIRKGKVNAWKESISPEIAELFDDWTIKSLNRNQIPFDYPLFSQEK